LIFCNDFAMAAAIFLEVFSEFSGAFTGVFAIAFFTAALRVRARVVVLSAALGFWLTAIAFEMATTMTFVKVLESNNAFGGLPALVGLRAERALAIAEARAVGEGAALVGLRLKRVFVIKDARVRDRTVELNLGVVALRPLGTG
jgi:hypothetical protein